MKNYDKLYNIITDLEIEAKSIDDETMSLILLTGILKAKKIVKEFIDDQEAEMASMAEEFERIDKLNKKLGELLNDKK